MKSKVTFFPVIATMLLLGGCTAGSYVTDRYDDIYFSPGDVPPPVVAQSQPADEAEAPLVVSDPAKGENHIFTSERPNADAHVYDMDNMELVASDTSYLDNEDGGSTIINNYYEGDDIDFAYRINRFHRYPFYDPFYWDSGYYDPFYSPYYSWGYYDWYWPGSSLWFGAGIGWGWYSSWYSPWYSPYYSWGYNDWGYYHGHHWDHHYYDSDRYSYGHRRESYSTVNRNSSYGNRSSSTFRDGTRSSYRNSASAGQYGTIPVTGRSGRVSGTTSGTPRTAGNNETIMERRRATPSGSAASVSGRRSISGTGNGQIINDPSGRSSQNRNISNSYSRQASPSVRPTNGSSYQRSSGTSQSRSYTPSYSKPRTVTRSTYNNNSSSETKSTYTAPSESQSNSRSSYRSGTSYNRGSSSSSRPTYTAPTRSSGSSYRSNSSTPSRSTYSSPASSGSSGGGGGRSSGGGSGRR